MSTEMEFKIEYCKACETDMIICPKCGNNCCNGGSGKVNGEPCDVCSLAYQYQQLVWDKYGAKVSREGRKFLQRWRE